MEISLASSHLDDALPALAVLGDSDSHSYHDLIQIPAASPKRGGRFRQTTWQWTEVLEQLRGRHVDQGAWGTWGTRIRYAYALDWIGWGGRAPRKQDYRYNFSLSGAESQDLMTGHYRQAPRLVSLMQREPARWENGIVAIRIGVNTIGQAPSLERYAREGPTPAVTSEIQQCAAWIRKAVEFIRQRQPRSRIVLVGICDNSHMPSNAGRWQSAGERGNISAALDLFDGALREIAEADPRIAFFDDRKWFGRHWGGRDAHGQPAYRSANLGGRESVRYASGDEPGNAILADEHAGSAWNALWAMDFVALLNSAFALQIPPISIGEIAGAVDPEGAFGLRAMP